MDLYPHLHPRPATGWVNDPNGIGFWDGRWHVMMQWNPGSARWGDIHWAHLSSPDLVTWEEHPAALTPRPGAIDAGGCWSGVATVDDAGVRCLVYSATPRGPEEAGVAIARDRGDGTYAQPDAMILPQPDGAAFEHIRDPFLFRHEGRRLGLQGCGRDGRGAALLFEVAEFDRWEPLGVLLAAADVPDPLPSRGQIWECPQLVRVGETWVLVVSWADLDNGPRGAVAYAGDLVADQGGYRFEPRTGVTLDHGPDFYAPQAAQVGARAVVFGWSDEGTGPGARTQEEIDASGWAGTMTLPREVVLDDAGLARLRIVPEARALVGDAVGAPAPEGGTRIVDPAWMATATGPWRLSLTGPDGERDVAAGDGPAEVWVDGSIVEAFGPEGSTTLRAYPAEDEAWAWHATGAAPRELRLP
ncbi:glycoside hydrolase family 32 protein [Demequina lignilytica]|uniref:beta-fructofuranosidase n=1 Tax=Demequina lignilytica TaxID=3051663 RepID=A0AB35MKA7_9MICO|nr:glycoside hydrolase family 32 protein [Demequina sp. SYSU T0a273]MDN4484198.1 glycoside hydrolase family 32 protein [Demequina sp. SYSU T0a273]